MQCSDVSGAGELILVVAFIPLSLGEFARKAEESEEDREANEQLDRGKTTEDVLQRSNYTAGPTSEARRC